MIIDGASKTALLRKRNPICAQAPQWGEFVKLHYCLPLSILQRGTRTDFFKTAQCAVLLSEMSKRIKSGCGDRGGWLFIADTEKKPLKITNFLTRRIELKSCEVKI